MDKVFAISIRELPHLKILLSAWYGFLKENLDNKILSEEEFTSSLKSPVIYNQKEDRLELLLSGPESLLDSFKKEVLFQKDS